MTTATDVGRARGTSTAASRSACPGKRYRPSVQAIESSGSEQRPEGVFARRLRLNGTPAAGGDLRVSTLGAAMSGPVAHCRSARVAPEPFRGLSPMAKAAQNPR